MANKFHVNPANGEASKCSALKGKCPFGASEEHFESQEEASQYYENKTTELINSFKTKNDELETLDSKLSKLGFQIDALRKRVREGTSKDVEDDLSRLESMELNKHRSIENVRNAWYAREIVLKEIAEKNLLSTIGKFNPGTKAAKEANMKYVQTMKLNVELNEIKHYRATLLDEYSSWAGVTRAQAAEAIDAYDEKSGMTRDEYIVNLFQNNLDTTKERVYIDLETSGFHPTTGEIIEIGIVRVNGKGEVIEEIKERFDIAREDVRNAIGVGPTHIHKIAPEDVIGKPKFTDPEVQKRMGTILNNKNAVVIAHNKNFENEFLDQFLEGYSSVRNSSAPENLLAGEAPGAMGDTRALSGFLIHSIPNNKLESFVLANGIAYDNAHTAIDDARMTFQALENFKLALKNAPPGKRPVLSWATMPPPKVTNAK